MGGPTPLPGTLPTPLPGTQIVGASMSLLQYEMILGPAVNPNYATKPTVTSVVTNGTTSEKVGNFVAANVQTMINVFNQIQTKPSVQPTQADWTALNAAYHNLADVYKYGLPIDSNGNIVSDGNLLDPNGNLIPAGEVVNANGQGSGIQYTPPVTIQYMNMSMANSFNSIDKFFQMAGWNATSPTQAGGTGTNAAPANGNIPAIPSATAAQAQVLRWFDTATAGLPGTLNAAITSAASWQSIQALIELQYVKAGNDLISQKMGNLQSELNLTQQAVQILTTVQNLHNKVSPVYPSSYKSPNPGSSASDFYTNYSDYASQQFGGPIEVAPNVNSNDIASYNATIGQLNAIANQIQQITGIGPSSTSYSSSLQSYLRQVANDMSKNTIQTWIIDGQGSQSTGGSEGTFQNNIAQAQTSAQTLNTSQQQEVQSTLFVFQEFYQSASAMLQQITQIIQSMAQHTSSQ